VLSRKLSDCGQASVTMAAASAANDAGGTICGSSLGSFA
jgi:hypothetical protein